MDFNTPKLTVRDIIKDIQKEVQRGDLKAPRAAEILTELAALIGNCNDEIRNRDMEYNKKLLVCLETEEKANRAKIKAEISPEYQAKREARDTKELAIELIRSIKYFLKSLEEEKQTSKFQNG